MNITKEQAESILAILGNDSDAFVILNITEAKGIEVCTVSVGPIAIETMRVLADGAAEGMKRAIRASEGCQCPNCSALRALSNNAPQAQA